MFFVIHIVENITCYEDLWLVGDNFVAKTFWEGVKLREKSELFIVTNFNVHPVNSSKYESKNTNILSWIENAVARKLNDVIKLPQYIAVVLDDDLVDALGYDLQGACRLLGEWIGYLTRSFKQMIHDRKSKLPRGAIRFEYPLIY